MLLPGQGAGLQLSWPQSPCEGHVEDKWQHSGVPVVICAVRHTQFSCTEPGLAWAQRRVGLHVCCHPSTPVLQKQEQMLGGAVNVGSPLCLSLPSWERSLCVNVGLGHGAAGRGASPATSPAAPFRTQSPRV